MVGNEDKSVAVKTNASRRRGRLLWAALVGALLFGVALLVALDPFGWYLLERLNEEESEVLDAIPPESAAIVYLDLSDTNLAQWRYLRDTFVTATADKDFGFDDLRRGFDDTLQEELAVSFEADMMPWMGQRLAFAIVSLTIDEFDGSRTSAWVLAVETEEKRASDQFLEQLSQRWTEREGETAVTESYEGVTLTQFEQLAFARDGRLVLLASSGSQLRQALDALKGESMAADPAFQEAMDRLPDEHLLSAYLDGAQLNQLLATIPTPLPRIGAHNLPTASAQNVVLALSLVDIGLQIDGFVTHDPAALSPVQRLALETRNEDPQTASLLPEETVLYLTGQGVDLFWMSLRQAMIAEIGEADFEESMRLFAQQFGIDPDEALFPYLDGELALGIVPGPTGTLAKMSGVELEAVILIGTSNEETLADNLVSFSKQIGNPQGGFGEVRAREEASGLTLYEFDTPFFPDLLVAYGIGQDYLLIGSSLKRLASLQFAGGPSLAEQHGFRQAWQAFPADMSLGAYADVARVMEMLQASPAAAETASIDAISAVLHPVPYLAAGHITSGNIAHYRVIAFLEGD